MLNEMVSSLMSMGLSTLNLGCVKELEDNMILDSSYDAQFEVLDSDYIVEEAVYGKKANLGRGVLALIAKHGHMSKEGWVAQDGVLRAAASSSLSASATDQCN